VNFSIYNGIPHLLIPVVEDQRKTLVALNWAVQEMTQRYNTFAEFNVRNLEEYNHKVENMHIPDGEERPKKIPRIVIIINEFADVTDDPLPNEVNDTVSYLTRSGSNAGVHMIIVSQRPSSSIISGDIRANIPSRIAFSTTSSIDSRIIINEDGAEKLLGNGDMLFYTQESRCPIRLQGGFISTEEISIVVEFLCNWNTAAKYSSAIKEQVNTTTSISRNVGSSSDRDVYFEEAGKFIIEKEKASIGMLQRMFKIGFNRAARIMDQLCDAGVVGPEEGTKPRKALMSQSEFESYLEEH
jgi:S-DNA-T family DNA segregation ATPase FtsK/SpoIIIE